MLHVVALIGAHAVLSGSGAYPVPMRSGVSSVDSRSSVASVPGSVVSEPDLPLQIELTVTPPVRVVEVSTSAPVPEDSEIACRCDSLAPRTDVTTSPDAATSPPIAARVVPTKLSRVEISDDKPLPASHREAPSNYRKSKHGDSPSTSSLASFGSVYSDGQLQKTTPSPRYNPPPAFPPEMLVARKSGVVIVQVQIDAEGRVISCKVQESSGHVAFDAAAVEAVNRWRFEPARRFGIPVATAVLCPIRFQFVES